MWPYHLSARVPWHDNGWIGTICKEPNCNTCCTALTGIKDNRSVKDELPYTGQIFAKVPYQLPCIREGVTFMSTQTNITEEVHPYSYLWKNLQPTKMELPPYTISVVPFEADTNTKSP